ncbi:type VII secretion target [Mycolicibacterium fortuitum]|uniref:type VII secretion target n=1 Tax=Mycolicibacterium fortuitum TaxID=1766 RepID=UPI003AAC871A
MTDPNNIHITPEVLQSAALGHDEAATYLRGVPSSNAEIQATLDSLGPVFAELREEGRIKLDERQRSYHAQADEHERTAANLHEAHSRWDTHEQTAARQFREVTDNA